MNRAILEFWSFEHVNVRWVVCGAILLGASAAMIGVFSYLRKQSLAGDTLAHAALPGVVFAFLLSGTRAPGVLLLGAISSCALAFVALEYLRTCSKIREDSALAIVLSSSFALGLFLLGLVQKSGNPEQAGLDKLLFGQAASLVPEDLYLLAAVSALLVLLLLVIFRPLRIVVFDPLFAQANGIPIRIYDFLLASMLVLAIAVGLQLVGVVLMAALLVTPAAAARYWTNRLPYLLLIAACFGALSGVLGAQVSFLAPGMPTGPWMVVAISLLFLFSLLFAPQRGLLSRIYVRRKSKRRQQEENVLRSLYKQSEERGSRQQPLQAQDIQRYRELSAGELERTLRRLEAAGDLQQRPEGITLTDKGAVHAKRITRRHRLWELYLARRLSFAPDHAHLDAEDIEHVLTPELEERLAHELARENLDPHGRAIPQSAADELEGSRDE
jgi:manganese/zinc/iron transport system permease protein